MRQLFSKKAVLMSNSFNTVDYFNEIQKIITVRASHVVALQERHNSGLKD